jgi:hypothetical protein
VVSTVWRAHYARKSQRRSPFLPRRCLQMRAVVHDLDHEALGRGLDPIDRAGVLADLPVARERQLERIA